MLLKKQETQEMWAEAKKHHYDVSHFAELVGRAVLAKAVSLDDLDETEGFIDFFNERLNVIADKHPTKIVRQMAQLLRKERQAKAVDQGPVGYADLSRVNPKDAPRLTHEKFTDSQSPVYAHSLPAQAIPEEVTGAINSLDRSSEYRALKNTKGEGGFICGNIRPDDLVTCVEFCRSLSASPKPGDNL